MSGGHFEYNQYKIGQIADEIEEMVFTNDSTEKDDCGCEKGYHFTPETVVKFMEAVTALRKALIMVQRVDWLVSGDDGEDSFHRRWEDDMARLAEWQGGIL